MGGGGGHEKRVALVVVGCVLSTKLSRATGTIFFSCYIVKNLWKCNKPFWEILMLYIQKSVIPIAFAFSITRNQGHKLN